MAENQGSKRNSFIFALLATLVVGLIVVGLLRLNRSRPEETFALHWSDTWTDAGAIDGYVYFRDGNTLSAFDQNGMRWKQDLTPQAQIAYGAHVFILENDALSALQAKDGSLLWTKEHTGYTALRVLPPTGEREGILVAQKADRFLCIDEKTGAVDFVQVTQGAPGAFAAGESWRAWTEEGDVPGVQIDGARSTLVDLSPLLIAETPTRTILSATPWDVSAVPAAQSAEDAERDPALSALPAAQVGRMPAFRTPVTRPVTTLLSTGADSFVAASETALYFIQSGVLTKVLPGQDVVDIARESDGCAVVTRDALVRYDAAGQERERRPLDFEPKAVAAGETSLVVAGASHALVLSGGNEEKRETGEFVRKVEPERGAPLLIYREEVVPVK